MSDSHLPGGRPPGIRLTRLAVHAMPGSGSAAELLAWAGIDAEHIADAARRLIGSA